MIDKISGNGSYELPGGKKRKNPAVRAYEQAAGQKGDTGKGAAGAAKKRSGHLPGKEDTGVVLDLSKQADRKQASTASGRKKESSLPGALRKLLAPVVQWLRDFWGPGRTEEEQMRQAAAEMAKVQAEPEEGGDQTAAETAEMQPDPAIAIEEEQAAAEMEKQEEALAKQALKSGDLHQVERFLTQNGRKRLAHNSDLLTYYDRRGKFVEMDETEKHRVLYGDKNVLKL